ncbi:uncharacterized protein DUF4917 [Leucobacter luti]|uniref:Uncharacterized protein DUF4917 n=1 Tax=Leucobacter luti TaxID=340320 RepID=A0A4R6RV27_9MICO|nr:DUF4917 family protein [Leucobacter luti]TDP90247.1 uncharacterized protein DUF4917 [Leucobacter luti]
MITETLKFSDAIELAKLGSEPLSVLLGNGFSRACRDDTFNYGSLWDRADFTLTGEKVEIEEAMNSKDFETVIRRLDRCANLLAVYGGDSEIIGQIEADSTAIRTGLAAAIARLHPAHAWTLDSEERRNVNEFLAHFTSLFTTNYDLLLYWAVNHAASQSVPKDDGFRGSYDNGFKWRLSNSQKIYYLHGAIHLFEESSVTTKAARQDGLIMDEIRDRIALQQHPLIVTEGSSIDKRVRIEESKYLSNCYDQLGSLSGALFIHGSSLSSNDEHLFNQITREESGITTLFVSVRPGSSEAQIRVRAHDLSKKRRSNGGTPLKLHFYDAESAHVWR